VARSSDGASAHRLDDHDDHDPRAREDAAAFKAEAGRRPHHDQPISDRVRAAAQAATSLPRAGKPRPLTSCTYAAGVIKKSIVYYYVWQFRTSVRLSRDASWKLAQVLLATREINKRHRWTGCRFSLIRSAAVAYESTAVDRNWKKARVHDLFLTEKGIVVRW